MSGIYGMAGVEINESCGGRNNGGVKKTMAYRRQCGVNESGNMAAANGGAEKQWLIMAWRIENNQCIGVAIIGYGGW